MTPHSVFVLVVALLQFGVIVRAIMIDGRDPYSRLAWVMALIALPILSSVAYAIFGEPWMTSRFRRKANRSFKQLGHLLVSTGREDRLDRLPKHFMAPFKTCEAIGPSVATEGNTVELTADSLHAIDMLVADIAGARDTVHISFYIWLTDHSGLKVVEAICGAAARGVRCRISADAIGSRALIHSPSWTKMKVSGAQLCASLSSPKGLSSIAALRLDLRNHRKIVVIDNLITYCGSQNCADPEFLIKARYAPWVDIMLRFTGPVALENQAIFASAWTVETGEDLTDWIEQAETPPRDGDVLAIAFPTGPLSVKGAMSNAFVSVIVAAQDEIVISTPYFIPDPPLLAAILSCARRGVQTTLILPMCNDSRVVGAISRSLYPQLINAGVRVFEYRGGLLHSKTLVADQTISLVGSANMDRRSLELNFENNILLYSAEVSCLIRQRQANYLASSVEITRADITNRSFISRFFANIMTMASAIY